jgi:signal transduction histidine kinase
LRAFLFEAVNELLMNVVKHAGVDKAEVILSRSDDQIQLQVVDHGVGFDPAQVHNTSFGLFSIRERVELLGGRVEVDSTPGRGTCVRLIVPLREPEQLGPAT